MLRKASEKVPSTRHSPEKTVWGGDRKRERKKERFRADCHSVPVCTRVLVVFANRKGEILRIEY